MSVAVTELGPGTLLAGRRSSASEPERLVRLRDEAARQFAAVGVPTIRQEAWRFTNIAEIGRAGLRNCDPTAKFDQSEVGSRVWSEAATVVVVDGQLRTEFSGPLPEGIPEVLSLAAALAANHEVVCAELGRHAETGRHPIAALNTALFSDGIAVLVAPHAVVDRPRCRYTVFLLRARHDGIRRDRRGLLPAGPYRRRRELAGTGCRALGRAWRRRRDLVAARSRRWSWAPVRCSSTLACSDETDGSFLLGLQQLEVARSANVASRTFTFGGGIVRNDVGAKLRGEGIACALDGLYVTRDQQLVDNHMVVDHIAPHCDSHELFKGILDGRSRAVFNGLLHVHPGAQKTDAKQTNRNLLLSNEALVNTNPQLEIYADDVKCTHGSTVGELDPEAVFYLRSRGIGENAARSLLTWAFAREIVDHVGIAPLVAELEERLIRRLPSAEVLRQAGR